MNGDGKPDIVMSNKTGLYYFEQLNPDLPFGLGLLRLTPSGRSKVNRSQFLRLVFSNEPTHRIEGLGQKMRAAWFK